MSTRCATGTVGTVISPGDDGPGLVGGRPDADDRQKRGAEPFLAELTLPEVRPLLEIALPLPPRSAQLRLAGSAWPRAKRYLAGRYHYRRSCPISVGSFWNYYHST